MALEDGFLGRAITLTWGGEAIGGVKSKSVTFGGDAIDVSDDDSDGWRVLLEEDSSRKQLDIALSGVTKSHALKEAYFSGPRTDEAILTYPDGSTLTGRFYLSALAETGPYEDAMTYEATLQSTGAVEFQLAGA